MNFDPFAQWGKAFETWQKLTEDAFARTSALFAEAEKMNAKRVESASTAIDELAKLQKETLAYGVQLGTELRKVSLDALKNAGAVASSSSSAT